VGVFLDARRGETERLHFLATRRETLVTGFHFTRAYLDDELTREERDFFGAPPSVPA